MTRMLASVTSVAEASLALEAGADLIDIKDPARGALGALAPRIARDIVETVGSFARTSATIGDFPGMDAEQMLDAATRTASLGVNYVKAGFWGTPRDVDCVRALARLATRARLVAVLFADLPQPEGMLEALTEAGFTGVMYDTAHKRGSPLRLLKSETELALFVRRARGLGLLCGLAGKLGLADIAPLRALQPDYLGFRGALCAAGHRTGALDAHALAAVRAAMNAALPSVPERTNLGARQGS